MKKLFIDDYIKGGNDIIEDITGRNILFVYNDIEGSIEILKHDKTLTMVFFKYNEFVYSVPVKYFLNSMIFKVIFGNKNTPYLYKVGDVVGTYEILDYTRIRYDKAYVIRCNIDGYEKLISESGLEKQPTCRVCSGHIAIKGINSISDTDKWMCDYITNEDDWYNYVSTSKKIVSTTCPICGKEKYMSLVTLKKCGLGCNCGDGFSYPEKFTYSFLSRLEMQFDTEKTFEWARNKKYDFYISSLNCIIETNGGQHYSEVNKSSTLTFRSLKYEQANDKLKRELALSNGIKHYIELDCRKSDIEWIKNSIMNSELPELLNFKEVDIDWMKCHELALKNRIKEACELWNSGNFKSSMQLSTYMNVSRQTINNYLNKGNDVGWCHYIGKEEMSKNAKSLTKENKPFTTKIIEAFKNDMSIGVFYGSYDVSRHLLSAYGIKSQPSHIISVCNGDRFTHKGLTFKYLENTTIEELKESGRLIII